MLRTEKIAPDNIVGGAAGNAVVTASDVEDEILHMQPRWGQPERIRALKCLPGTRFNVGAKSAAWIALEELYLAKTRRENYKSLKSALGWWNIYLFYYLPQWFGVNLDSNIEFPESPEKLVSSVFFSRLLPVSSRLPMTFMEMMDAQARHREWEVNGYYGLLKQLEHFFAFIEAHAHELPGCAGFKQPFSSFDAPVVTRRRGTNKLPVPRRLFKVYLDFHEAVLAHLNAVLAGILEGRIRDEQLPELLAGGNVIDTFATSHITGFVPVLFTPHKTIPLQFVPEVLDLKERRLLDGRRALLPHPHGLHQHIVALHTGIRHSHIQWLDRERFDQGVAQDSQEFACLHVNTDKARQGPWSPHVSMRVISVLRSQKAWSELLDEPGFADLHFYNNNERTRWPKFKPLFAYLPDGRPHSDSVYTETWQRMLCGLQGLLPELQEFGPQRPLLRLLPPGLRPNDSRLTEKLQEYGSSVEGRRCILNVMTQITPHSARVSVVSQYITFLPADIIGKQFTGQTAATVAYYVRLEQDDIEDAQTFQAAKARERLLQGAFEPVLGGERSGAAFIRADKVDSSLMRSLRSNVDETLVSYGCISITFTDCGKKGVDVLRETRAAGAAANATELCPYGNHCPPEVIKDLRGLKRCSLCYYAVRCVDHLPAVLAAKRKLSEELEWVDQRMRYALSTEDGAFTAEELDELEKERSRMGEELAGWILSEEVLEITRRQLKDGERTRKWVVQRPEIIERDLARVEAPSNLTSYLLARLGECVAFPSLESPQVRAKFDLLRRDLLARTGQRAETARYSSPANVAGECAGLLRAVVQAYNLTATGLANLLETDEHLETLPPPDNMLLSLEAAN